MVLRAFASRQWKSIEAMDCDVTSYQNLIVFNVDGEIAIQAASLQCRKRLKRLLLVAGQCNTLEMVETIVFRTLFIQLWLCEED